MKMSKAQAQKLGIQLNGTDWIHQARPKGGKGSKGKAAGGDQLFLSMCKAHGLPVPVAEYEFAKDIGRRWRFDWLFDSWLALEIQGGLFTDGGHNRGAYMRQEHEKRNEAVILGYSILFCTPDDVTDGSIFPVIARALAAKDEQS